jgi:hypothetical protein
MKPDPDDEQHARPFADFLTQQTRAHDELTEGLHELTAAVRETGKAGTITLTIKISADKKTPDILRVSDNVTVKAPAFDRGERIYFTDHAGNLTRSNPMQPELEGLRDVSAPASPKPLKEVQ